MPTGINRREENRGWYSRFVLGRRGVGALAAVVLAAIVIGCVSVQGETIDGWTVGTAANCAPDCARFVDAATTALDRREPGHAAVASVTLYEEMNAPGRTTPCCEVAVFTLIDQNVYAIGVGWNILKDVVVTIDHGP